MAIDFLGIADLKQQIARWNTSFNVIHDLKSLLEVWETDSCDVGIHSLMDIRDRAGCDGGIYQIEEIVGAGTYFEPVGQSFCELLSTKTFIENDLFLISRHEYDDDGTLSSSSSRKVRYNQLSGKLAEDVLDRLNLKTMAFEYKSRYAISSHLHDDIYSKCELIVNPKYQLDCVDESEISNLCHINIETDYIQGNQSLVYKDINKNPSLAMLSGTSLSINMPKIVVPIPPKPLIGTMKFIGIQTIQALIDSNGLVMTSDGLNVNPYDDQNKIRDDYDGWVFPNGQLIPNYDQQLSNASLVFHGISNANVITLPNISEFFKINPCTRSNGSNYIYKTYYQTGIGQHFHLVDPLNISGDLELDEANTKIRSTDRNGSKINVHHGNIVEHKNWSDPFEFDVTFDNIKFDPALTTTEDGSVESPNYPTHNVVPIMIYIGGETRSFYENLHAKYNQSE